MNIKFLDDLNNFIKDNNLFSNKLSHVYISNKFLPSGLKKAVSARVRKEVSLGSELDNNFELFYDNRNELCIKLTYNEGKTNIILKNGKNKPQLNETYTMYDLESIIYEASVIELKEELYETMIESLEIYEPELNENERKQKSIIKVDEIMKEFSKQDIIDGALIEDKLNRILPSIKDYIRYCYNYVNGIKVDDENFNISAFDRGIDYVQRKGQKIINEDSDGVLYLGPKERVNEVINYELREMFLYKLKPIMVDFGNDEEKKQAEYKCLLYKIDDTKYKFLFEPFSGKKATKVFLTEYDGEMNYAMFCKMVEHYLEMSEHEVIESEYGIRFNHTKEDVYENVIGYAIRGIESDIRPLLKLKIDNLEYDLSFIKGKSL